MESAFLKQLLQNINRTVPESIKRHLAFTDPVLQISNYWKSKVTQIHAKWKNVTDTVDLDNLDKKHESVEKKLENKKMPKFTLGDRVKISVSNIRTFKVLHKKIGIWEEGMQELIGKEAIVMNLYSPFAIVVALIENGEIARIHGYALKLVQNEISSVHWQNDTDLKIDEEVIIGVEPGILIYLQESVRKTPHQRAAAYIDLIGRVVAFFKGEVVVTFDEMTHEMFNPAALTPYSSDEKEKQNRENTPEIGKKVTVKQSLQDVMFLQRGHGGWHYKMTKYLGKMGTVIDQMGEDVIVEFNLFERYCMNLKNVEEVKKKRQRSNSGIAVKLNPFSVGDTVRLKIDPQELHSTLILLRIPLEFLAIVSGCAEFVGYLDQIRGVIDFGDGKEFIFDLALLTKVKDSHYSELRHMDKTIGVGIHPKFDILIMHYTICYAFQIGKKVMLWTGPKNFAKSCVSNMKDGFENALASIAEVKGYDDQGNAVIQYGGDGEMYSVPEDYLCSPRSEWINKPGEVQYFDWHLEPIKIPTSISAVEAQILHSVTEVLKSNEESAALDWKSKVSDSDEPDTRKIEIKFSAEIQDCNKFLEKFKSKLASEYDFVRQCNKVIAVGTADEKKFHVTFNFETSDNFGEVTVCDDPTPPMNLRRATSLDENESVPPSIESNQTATREGKDGSETEKSSFKEAVPFDNSARPVTHAQDPYNIQIPVGVTNVVLHIGGSTVRPPPTNPVTEPITDGGNQGNIIGSLSPGSSINMFVDGPVNIFNSRIRRIAQS